MGREGAGGEEKEMRCAGSVETAAGLFSAVFVCLLINVGEIK